MGTILALAFFLLCIVKMCCGYNPDEAYYYQEVGGTGKPPKHVTVVGNEDEDLLGDGGYNDSAAYSYDKQANRLSRGNEEEGQDSSAFEDPSAMRQSTSALEKYAGYRSIEGQRFGPKEDDDVSCGIEVEQAPADFEHLGVLHNKGTYRIRRVEERGVCERQGVCKAGDILVHINGVPVAGLPLSKVHSRLRGKASSKVYLGLILEGSRTVTERAVVLAHFPALASSPRIPSGSYQNGEVV